MNKTFTTMKTTTTIIMVAAMATNFKKCTNILAPALPTYIYTRSA